jgi:hypothetical protein
MADITWVGGQRHLDLLEILEYRASRVSGFRGRDACRWKGSDRFRERDLRVAQEMLCLTEEERRRKTYLVLGGTAYLVHLLNCHSCQYELSYRPLRFWNPERGYAWRNGLNELEKLTAPNSL